MTVGEDVMAAHDDGEDAYRGGWFKHAPDDLTLDERLAWLEGYELAETQANR